MNFKLLHQTNYTFSSEVFLEPHYFRFRPKSGPFIDVSDFAITISPEPEGRKVLEDEERNIVDFCWFEKLTTSLTISVESTIQTTTYNPFNFIIYPDTFNTVPFTYTEHQYQTLSASLQTLPIAQPLVDYASQILQHANNDTITFVTNLTSQIHKDFSVEYRETGAPLTPNQTFETKKGSCRDLSWMQIHLLRSYGIASRFVSGYFYFETEKPVYELHAWVEVFLPSIGWLGFDPSHGILTGNTHFSLASSALAENTMPVSGGIRGSATSALTALLHIEKL